MKCGGIIVLFFLLCETAGFSAEISRGTFTRNSSELAKIAEPKRKDGEDRFLERKASAKSDDAGPASRTTISRSAAVSREVAARNVQTRTAAPAPAATRLPAAGGGGTNNGRALRGNPQSAASAQVAARAGIKARALAMPITASPAATVLATEEAAAATETCKARYAACMDNFCNVLDANQGRCSCSANIKNYAKSEESLKQATEMLQDIAAKIQFIGLSADEITALFVQTEGEQAMSGSTDSSALKSDLDKISKMVLNVKSTGPGASDSSVGIDLSGMSFDSGFDISSMFDSGGANIFNTRGADLYKAAAARCRASILKSCAAAGADSALVSQSYDLEIDKQCLVYQRNLEDSITQSRRTIKNAESVLQKARLSVLQNQNQYDAKACVRALDACMQDEFVCGEEYANCLDPTGRNIAAGAIAPDFSPDGLAALWNYGSPTVNAFGTGGSIGGMIATIPTSGPFGSGNIMQYLLVKLGYADSAGRSFGNCMPVLNKCRAISYHQGKYAADNEIVKEYLDRALMQIKSRQDKAVAEYRESCIADIKTCLSGFSSTKFGTSASDNGSMSSSAYNACLAQNNTCTTAIGNSGTDMISELICFDNASDNVAVMADAGGGYKCNSVGKILYHADGETLPHNAKTTFSTTAYTLPGLAARSSGANFTGWCENAALTLNCANPKTIPANTPTAELHFYAKFACPAGKYGAGNGETCSACAAGYTSDAGSAAAMDCKISCAAGTLVLSAGGQCALCAPGYRCSSSTVSQGQVSPDAVKTKCLAGTFAPSGSATCYPCPAGRYCATDGLSIGVICPTNTYSAGGATGCRACPSGYGITGTAETDHDALAKCSIPVSAGKYIAAPKATIASECPAGNWCIAAYIQYGQIGNKRPCPTGTFSPESSGTCTTCWGGMITNATGKTIIADCQTDCPNKIEGAAFANPNFDAASGEVQNQCKLSACPPGKILSNNLCV